MNRFSALPNLPILVILVAGCQDESSHYAASRQTDQVDTDVLPTSSETDTAMNDGPRNILHIRLETWRQDFESDLSAVTSKQGFLVPLAWNVAAWTHPTTAAADTGTWMRPEAFAKDWELSDDIVTGAEILEQTGYLNRYFNVGNALAGSASNLDQGYTEVDGESDVQGQAPTFEEQAEETLVWLEKVRKGELWYAHLHTYDTHAPYGQLDPSCADQARASAASCPIDLEQAEEGEIHQAWQGLTTAQEKTACSKGAEALNRCEAIALGTQLVSFLGVLKNEGLLDNTVLVIDADHGEEYVPEAGHNKSLAKGQTAGFFWAWAPGFYQDSQGSYPYAASQVDYLPTMLDIAGVDYDVYQLDGVSLADRTEPVDHPITSFWCFTDQSIWKEYAAVSADGTERLILNRYEEYELYNESNDPDETTDISSASAGLPTELTQAIMGVRDTMQSSCTAN